MILVDDDIGFPKSPTEAHNKHEVGTILRVLRAVSSRLVAGELYRIAEITRQPFDDGSNPRGYRYKVDRYIDNRWNRSSESAWACEVGGTDPIWEVVGHDETHTPQV